MGIMDTLSGAIYGDRHSSVSDLLSNISLNNRYSVRLANPVGLSGLFDIEKDSFRVQQINFPNSNLELEETRYQGIRKEIAKYKSIDSINVTFLDADKGALREKFQIWQNYIFSGGKLAYYNDYIASELQLNILSFQNPGDFRTVHFQNVFPIQIGDISYTRETTAELVKFNVAFSCKDFYYTENSFSNVDGLNIVKKIQDGINSGIESITNFIRG